MQRKSYITQHPHQEIRRGGALYASSTATKASTNEAMDFQLVTNHLPKHSTLAIDHSYLEDEDSDERTLYFARSKNKITGN